MNPRENPWKDLRCKCWSPSAEFAARTPGQGKVLKGGVAWRIFRDEGWVWQNIDVPDYMHFDTGYPSRLYRAPRRGASPSPSAGSSTHCDKTRLARTRGRSQGAGLNLSVSAAAGSGQPKRRVSVVLLVSTSARSK